jgi:hypothetical protein
MRGYGRLRRRRRWLLLQRLWLIVWAADRQLLRPLLVGIVKALLCPH